MSMKYSRYDRGHLTELVSKCASYTEVLRQLGKKPVGGSITNISLMCKRWKIDTSHMTGQAHNKGKRSNYRSSPEQRLKMGNSTDHRIEASKLRRSLFEIGVEHKCNVCGISEWLGHALVLEIDHIDEQYWNNQRENLQFLCPNCHSMKSK